MRTLSDVVASFVGIIGLLLPLIVALTVLVFLWGLVKFIAKSGDAKGHEEGKSLMIWGLVGLFLMLSLFGVLRLFYTDLGFGSVLGIPLLPTGR